MFIWLRMPTMFRLLNLVSLGRVGRDGCNDMSLLKECKPSGVSVGYKHHTPSGVDVFDPLARLCLPLGTRPFNMDHESICDHFDSLARRVNHWQVQRIRLST